MSTGFPTTMARPMLAVLLLAMAVGQLADLPGFVAALEAFEFGGGGPAWAFAVLVLITELVAGVNLLRRTGSGRHLGATLAVAVATAWTVLGVQGFARGLTVENCGCFGVYLAQPVRWWVLVEDAEFIALAWWVHRKVTEARARRRWARPRRGRTASSYARDGDETTARLSR